MRVIVDGMNVIGSRPDGWWKDRPAARRALVDDLRGLASQGHDVTVVFDGRPRRREIDEETSAGVAVLFAPGGPNAADRVIADLVAKLAPTPDLTVVTSDEALARQARALGAKVEGSGAFRARLGR
ncbi:MAG: NYN domain-containing protein [Acidimicrobiales bacterium]